MVNKKNNTQKKFYNLTLVNKILDQSKLHDYSIVDGTKIHLIVKKDNESSLTKELKAIGKGYVTDVDQFAAVFNQVSYLKTKTICKIRIFSDHFSIFF